MLSKVSDDLRIIACEEVAVRLGWSLRTLERRCAEGTGPKITKLSARRKGVRADHLRQWLDAQQEANTAA